ncbi:MAG: hypothetical protein WD229_08020, partial [Pirellulales bacterium]
MHAGRLLAVERLDQLKESSRQLTVTVEGNTTALPAMEGAVIQQRLRGRQWEVFVRGLDEVSLERLRFAEGVVAVESRTPSLEEIFVGYMTMTPQATASTLAAMTDRVELGSKLN